MAVARPSRAPPSEAPPAGRGGLARFTCGWPQSGRGQSRRLWPAQVPAGGRAQGRAIRSTLLRPRIDPACAAGLRAPPVRPSLPPRSFDPSFEPLAHRSPNPTPHPPQTRRCAPPVRPLAPLPPRLAPIYGVARRWRVRQRMCNATQAHRRPAWQSRPRRDRGARRARCGARPSRACAPPSLRRARTAAAAGRRNGRRSPPRRTREHRRRVERGRVGCYGAARPRRSLRAAAWRLVKQPRQPLPVY